MYALRTTVSKCLKSAKPNGHGLTKTFDPESDAFALTNRAFFLGKILKNELELVKI